jgi:hypothetical protein
MSINGITNPLLSSLGSIGRPDTNRPTNDRAGAAANAALNAAANARAALKPQAPIAGQAALQNAVPAEAPAGTDPTLWSVLTADERNFFAKTAALGPLTYGRIKAVSNAAPPAARGVRLDVRA